ncbi:MAG: hypothetical protein R3D84_00505 [Paracoccaceae bacterium]
MAGRCWPWAVLALTLVPGLLRADVANVSSGNHDGFTRLAVSLPAGAGWSLNRDGEGYVLRVESPDLRFDTSAVFKRIGKARLARIEPLSADTGLRFALNCDCHAIAFVDRPGFVVIDLRDGAPAAGSVFEAAYAAGGGTRPLPRPQRGTETTPETAPAPDGSDAVGSLAMAAQPLVLPEPDPAAPLTLPLGGLSDSALRQTRNAIAEQLSRAATQGLVELEVSPPGSQPGGSLPAEPSLEHADALESAHPERDDTAPDENHATGNHPSTAQLRIAATTAVDANRGSGPGLDLTPDGQACPDPADYDIAGWGDDRLAVLQLVDARTGLVGEFDHIDPVRALRLAQLYLYLGFGAEARQVLDQFLGPEAPEALLMLAALVDDPDRADAAALRGLASCEGPVSLWAALADPGLSAADAVDSGAILRGFSGLPLHLRRHLGLALAERLRAAGEPGAARNLRDALARAPGDHGANLARLDARLLDDAGATDDAERVLAEAVTEAGPEAGPAMAEFVEVKFRLRDSPEPALAAAVAALIRENRGTAAEPALKRARVLAAALAGDFDTGFDAADGTDARTRSDLWLLLGESGSDEALLVHGLAATARDIAETAEEARRRIAERFVSLGFADRSREWLAGLSGTEELLARGDLAAGDGRQALVRLAGKTTPEAQTLRAKALRQLGRFEDAAQSFERIDDAPNAAAMRVLAGDFATLRDRDESDLRLVLDPGGGGAPLSPEAGAPFSPPASPTLAASRALVEDTAAMRADLAALLAAGR